MLNKLLTFFLILFSFHLVAQTIEKGYYMFPVRPGEVNYLAGTMGELRATHFHTGLDIKTSGITGLPIFAAADGYIQRVRVSLGGYGNTLYMAHPNGTITVYAHLQEFQDDVAHYVRTQQYKKESFTLDLVPTKGRFNFKKGDVIALSGNSGSSSGPHLHFEIRDMSHKVLDPLMYGFDEIKDNLPPKLAKLAFVTMDKNSRVNGMFGRFEYNILERDGSFVLEAPVSLFGNIGVEAYAFDVFDGARNKNGILAQTLMFDFEPIFNQQIDNIEFNKQRNILAHTNYKRSKEGGRRFNKYYVDDGNLLKYYDTNDTQGVISIFDPLEHSIDIKLEDSYQNMVQYHLPLNDAGYTKDIAQKNMYFLNTQGYDVRKNTLEMIKVSAEEGCFARIFLGGNEFLYAHTYKAQGNYFYLWDLNNGLPDSVDLCGETLKFNFIQTIPSKQLSYYSDESIEINFPKQSLFDTLYFQYHNYLDSINQTEYFNFRHADIPMRQSAIIDFKPAFTYNPIHAAVYAVGSKGNLSYVGGIWKDNKITLKTKDLINYTIASDTMPPAIESIRSKSGFKIKISDQMSGIHSYRAELDGQWFLMKYDPKRELLIPDQNIPLKGKLTLVVKDNAENLSKAEYYF